VQDDGRGFDSSKSDTGSGLENIRDRVEGLLGNFCLHGIRAQRADGTFDGLTRDPQPYLKCDEVARAVTRRARRPEEVPATDTPASGSIAHASGGRPAARCEFSLESSHR
jgi:hypothetical protein